jgi:hypothetical protein
VAKRNQSDILPFMARGVKAARGPLGQNSDAEALVMMQVRRSSKRKRRKAALALGAAGVTLAMTGAASATAPTTIPSQDNARRFILAEEEISDVSLATFQVFDRENPPLSQGIKVARGGGCGGCGHGGGCGGCAHAGVGGGCAVGGRCAAGGGCAFGGRCVVGGRCACRGGCACIGVGIGVACLGCAGCSGTCWQWDPYLGQWVSVCY